MTEELMRRQRRPTLTDLKVAALPKKRKRYVKPDPEQRGHFVRVMPNGANVYCAIGRTPLGKQVWHTIGTADAVTIEVARSQAREAIRRIKAGLPAIEPLPLKPDSFQTISETWIKRHVAKEKLRSQKEIERCLSVYVLPHWKSRPFTGIKRSDITALLDYIEDNHGARQADLVLGIVRSIANWYATRHDDYLSPFTRGMRRHKAGARARILDDTELRLVWKQAEANGAFGAIVRLLLLSGQRREKIATLQWEDLDGDVWQIRTDDREKSNPGSLQLPAQAMAIIDEQPRLYGSPFVFPARGGGRFASFGVGKTAFDAKLPTMPRWTLHDLRRTSRSLLSRAGVRPDISERVLGHSIRGVEGIYDRHKYDHEKADALAKLAALIETILNPPTGNVRQFGGRRAVKS